jgi:ABC-type transport system substrate-binding protein
MLAVGLGAAVLSGAAGGVAGPKGGTLRVVQRPDFDFVDPALARSPEAQAVEHATCRTLYDATGPSLVPDAAGAAPSVSRDRLTWTFPIRGDLKYQTGDAITARDFAYAIRRDRDPRMSSPATVYTAAIASAKAAGTSRLVVRLKRPAPDLAARLSTTFFCPLPPGTPRNPNGIPAPVPGSGPYYVASWQRSRSLVLKRNRFYRGSRAANPDQIVFTMGASLENQRLQCETDAADVCGFPPNQAAALRAKYGVNRGRFWAMPQTTLWYLAVNRDGDLFGDNDRLAQAVNAGVDRAAIIRQSGAYAGVRTDQILPPGFPGFRNWNLYPLKGADKRKAKKLAKGNLRSGKCQLWTSNSGPGPAVAQTVKTTLAQIGLDCDITALEPDELLQKASIRGAGYDLLLTSWTAPYGDPFAAMNVILDGTQLHARNNVDLSYFEDSRWNGRLGAAATKSGRARRRTYSLLDRDLMRGPAPIVPLFASTQTATLVSSRVGCFRFDKVYGTDFGALCLDQQSSRLTAKISGAPGTVASEPSGFTCAATCSSDFPYGTEVTLVARPAPESLFVQWAGGCSGTNPRCTVTLNGARSVQAVFKKKRYPLTVTKAGPGAGTVTSDKPGIACGVHCSAAYDHGTVVTLTATPGTGSTFDGWSGSGCSGTGVCIVTVTAAKAVTATFGAPDHLAFTVQPATAQVGDAAIAASVTIEDALGKPVTNATNDVTVALGTNPSGGTLSGTVTRNAVGGVASFSGLSVDKLGPGYTLSASASGLTGAASSAFDVVLCGQAPAAGITAGGLQVSGRCSLTTGWDHTVLTAPTGKMFLTASAHGSACVGFPGGTLTCSAPSDGVICILTTGDSAAGESVTFDLQKSDNSSLHTYMPVVAGSSPACSTS